MLRGNFEDRGGAVLKVLFLPVAPIKGPSSRYRVYQLLPFLQRAGIKTGCHCALPRVIYDSFPPRRGFWYKLVYFGCAAFSRLLAVFRLIFYDAVFIQRLVLPHVYPFPELLICKAGRLLGKKVFFDFDDAIFTTPIIRKKTLAEKLTDPGRVGKVIASCDAVIAGNEFLAGYARRYNKNVFVVPTCLNLEKYGPLRSGGRDDPVIVGWIGTPGTESYLDLLTPVFRRLASRRRLLVRVVGGGRYRCPGVVVEHWPWSLAGEVSLLRSFTIGVMPLTDDTWSKGKCGLKLLQYMAAGVPVVASPVGVNERIIVNGENGFLARSTEEWAAGIDTLIRSPELRAKMAELARRTVEEKYSVQANVARLAAIMLSAGK
ncbi:MAG: glycosyltransferase family 1 protein [Peptococcaceae bacterium]|nr:MAG: glycosyltransferase family 1 protein [Peptococcaceae bacterium]